MPQKNEQKWAKNAQKWAKKLRYYCIIRYIVYNQNVYMIPNTNAFRMKTQNMWGKFTANPWHFCGIFVAFLWHFLVEGGSSIQFFDNFFQLFFYTVHCLKLRFFSTKRILLFLFIILIYNSILLYLWMNGIINNAICANSIFVS